MSPERVETTVDGKVLSLSNLDKVLYPKSGFTKSQVLDYYARIAEVMLPHLKNRPATFKRFPNGVDGMSFYEKHSPAGAPEWVRTISVPSKDGSHEPIDYTEVRDRPHLVWAANLAALEFHVPLWRVAKGKTDSRSAGPDGVRPRPRSRHHDRGVLPGGAVDRQAIETRRLRQDQWFEGSAALHAPLSTELGKGDGGGSRPGSRGGDAIIPNSWSRSCEKNSAKQGSHRLESKRGRQNDGGGLFASSARRSDRLHTCHVG